MIFVFCIRIVADDILVSDCVNEIGIYTNTHNCRPQWNLCFCRVLEWQQSQSDSISVEWHVLLCSGDLPVAHNLCAYLVCASSFCRWLNLEICCWNLNSLPLHQFSVWGPCNNNFSGDYFDKSVLWYFFRCILY